MAEVLFLITKIAICKRSLKRCSHRSRQRLRHRSAFYRYFTVMITSYVRGLHRFAEPQREIFPGGTKVDTGPPNLPRLIGAYAVKSFFVPAPNLGKIFFPIFCPKLGEEPKKRSSLKFSSIFCPKKWRGVKT